MTLQFDNSYARLPENFFAPQTPVQVPAPVPVAINTALATRLGIDPDWLAGPDGIAMLSGNALPPGTTPIAQAYAGHQFGNWVPRLGDGRAILLGEVIAPDGKRFDLQLKGAGPTPFSRGGDGRAWLGPVLREYLVSEAMAALGIPTTRALAALRTGDGVARDGMLRPGAVLTRVAQSHIRIGTFQYFAYRKDIDGLKTLTDHVIARHYPRAEGAVGLLRSVAAAQGRLIAGWMAMGFVHGVMNTDNMAVSGETIDYGPCAFLDSYHPVTVFSSIDHGGRYAYQNQPRIAAWNLAQLGSALLPLIGSGEDAIDDAVKAVDAFVPVFQRQWLARFGRKIGIEDATPEDMALIEGLLGRMAAGQADFTRTFRGLSTGTARDEFSDPTLFDDWARDWRARIAQESAPDAIMAAENPVRIPRNHQIEAVIQAALQGDDAPFHRLHAALAAPYDPAPEFIDYETAPRTEDRVIQTFCGT